MGFLETKAEAAWLALHERDESLLDATLNIFFVGSLSSRFPALVMKRLLRLGKWGKMGLNSLCACPVRGFCLVLGLV